MTSVGVVIWSEPFIQDRFAEVPFAGCGSQITVFSAPNYCDEMNNKGAFIRLAWIYKHLNWGRQTSFEPQIYFAFTNVERIPALPFIRVTRYGLLCFDAVQG